MMPRRALASLENRVLFGSAYYAEYRLDRDPAVDLDLMAEAGFTVIRVGESVWSTWEPSDGEFDVEWLRPVLDGAAERNISVILGTPTYAIPPWLQVKHPELAAEPATGRPMPWGSRQEVDFTSLVFRDYAERVIRKVLDTYAAHPSVVGFQVDNEPGVLLFHNEAVFAEFTSRLASKYGSPEALNVAWGLTYWSHRLTSFDELWRPDGNSFPQYDLEWRRYQADLTDEFIHWQAAIAREYASQDQFVTTCIAYPVPAMDDVSLTAALDVVAGNPYYEMQDGLDLALEPEASIGWAVSGVGKFFRQADRMWSSRQEPFIVTETNAQSIGGHSYNLPPYPGQLRQAALGFVARGARMIEYWHWQTLNHSFETYWGGVLPHSGVPGRIFREISELGRSLGKLGSALEGFRPDADIALVYSNPSKWAFEFFGPLAGPDRSGDPDSYLRIFDAFHTGVVESDRQARIIHDGQLAGLDPADFAKEHAVLIAPGFYIADDESLAWLNSYAESGGHLVVGIRTGYADEQARARREIAPPQLADAAGIRYDEYSNLRKPIPVAGAAGFPVSIDAAATEWLDHILVTDAEALLRYRHREFEQYPAITTRKAGAGRVTYVGTLPNKSLAKDLARWLVPRPHSTGWAGSAPEQVLTLSGTSTSGRLRFVFNWSGDEARVQVPVAVVDLDTDEEFAADSQVVLSARGARVLLER